MQTTLNESNDSVVGKTTRRGVPRSFQRLAWLALSHRHSLRTWSLASGRERDHARRASRQGARPGHEGSRSWKELP